MGKIQKALGKSKLISKEQDGSESEQRSSRTERAANAAAHKVARAPSLLREHATNVHLDADTLDRNRVVFGFHPSEAQTSYKMLRTRMLHRVAANNWHSIAVTSARAGAGKTLTAVNTALSLAREPNQQVILVDLDLRRPTVANVLGIEHKYGIVDYLNGNASIEQIVTKSNTDRLLIIPNFAEVENSSEMLSSPQMAAFVDIVSNQNNSSIVIFDLPPLLEADDFLAFSPLADAVLLVVAESETRQIELHSCMDLIGDVDILGLILNKSRNEDYPTGYYA